MAWAHVMWMALVIGTSVAEPAQDKPLAEVPMIVEYYPPPTTLEALSVALMSSYARG